MKKKGRTHWYRKSFELICVYFSPTHLVNTAWALGGFCMAILVSILAYKAFILDPPGSQKHVYGSETGHPLLLSQCSGQINGYINNETLAWFRKWITELNNEPTCKEATLNITSQGGFSDVASEIITLMSLSKVPIHTSCLSTCSSAAITILSHGTGTRYVSEFTSGAFHRPQIDPKELDVLAKNEYETFYDHFLPKFPEDIRDRVALGEDIGLKAEDFVRFGLADSLIKVPKTFSEDKAVSVEPYVKKSYEDRQIAGETTFAYQAIETNIVNQGGVGYKMHLRYSMDEHQRVCLNATLVSDGSVGNRQETYCYVARNAPKFNSGAYDESKTVGNNTIRDYFVWDYANNLVCTGAIFLEQSENGNRAFSIACEPVRYIDKELTAILGAVTLADQPDVTNAEISTKTSSVLSSSSGNKLKIWYYTDNKSYTCVTALSTHQSKMGKVVATSCYRSYLKPILSTDIFDGTKEAGVVTDFKIKDLANDAYCIGTQLHDERDGRGNTSVSLSCAR